MCDLYDDEIAEYYAWPQQIIFSDNKPVGFLMENINSDSKGTPKYIKIIKFYISSYRKKLFPNAEYKYMVHVAKNLAVAVETIHDKGIVIGDLNGSNIYINNTDATIKLLDCDSYQFEDFLCNVGKPDYTAPELPNELRGVKRTPNHDCFALAIMLFLILVGKHPYSGIGTPQEPRKAITQWLYCYGDEAKKKNVSSQYPFSEMYNLLNNEIKGLFEQAFNTTARPTAKDWINALEKYENELIQCSNKDNHWYNPEYKSCIWCDLEKDGFYAFGDISRNTKNNTNENILQYINHINELHRLIEITINISKDWDELPEIYKKSFCYNPDLFTDINSLRVLNESDIILQGYENLSPEAKKHKRHVLLFQNYITKYYNKNFKTLNNINFNMSELLSTSLCSLSTSSMDIEKVKLPPSNWDEVLI